MKKGIEGKYSPYVNTMEHGYSFDIHLENKIYIHGETYNSEEERDSEAERIAKELNIILIK